MFTKAPMAPMASMVVWTAQQGADVEFPMSPVVTEARSDVVCFLQATDNQLFSSSSPDSKYCDNCLCSLFDRQACHLCFCLMVPNMLTDFV